MSLNLLGIHEPDESAAALWGDRPGTVVFAVAIGANPNDKSGGDFGWWRERGFRVIVRLNNGWKPDGTIPHAGLYDSFAQRCANYVAASQGCSEWIIGNEPNHEQERPQGEMIRPHQYATCFSYCREAIKRVQPHARVLVAGPAPWNQTSGDWLDYWRSVLEALIATDGVECADGLAIHAYTQGTDPALITSDERRHGWLWHFRTYQDQLAAVPNALRHLPVDITETNQTEAWADVNSGWVQAAAREIEAWNARPWTQKVRSVTLYRWPRYDTTYSFADKNGVKEDFRAAAALGLVAPEVSTQGATAQPDKLFLPNISTGGDKVAGALPPRVWDERLTARGVTVETPAVAPGQQYFRVVEARWYDEQEAKGRHHIYANILDSFGNRVGRGHSLVVEWPGEHTLIYTEDKPGDVWKANYGMSKSLKEYSISVNDGLAPSEKVVGIGMGADGNPSIHTSTGVTFQLVTMPAAQEPAPPPTIVAPGPLPPSTVPLLAHPVADPRYRVVTQPFGPSAIDYSIYKVDGVPLRGHNGLDFATPVGSIIAAVADGTVVEVADEGDKGYGKYIKLAHAWGESVYAHLFGQFVTVGETVEKGQPIAASGNTGHSTGPHLHFGLRVAPFNRRDGWGGYSDPALYLMNTEATAPTPEPTTVSHKEIVEVVYDAAVEFGVEPELLMSLAWAESSFNPRAESDAGAQGLFQLMPGTWDEWHVVVGASNPFDATDSARVGAAYYAWLHKTLGNDWSALAAYNFGIGNVLNRVKPPDETVEFINKVLHGRDLLKAVGA